MNLLLLRTTLLLSWLFGASKGFVAIPADSGFQPRLELSTLARALDEWGIFLLAMDRFQRTPENQINSYFQVCGIHGSPHTYWDNNPPTQPPVANNQAGYCFHGTQEFFLWHRPYLMLFEQLLISNAKSIASSFKDPWLKALYTTAAGRLRLPYWDWAANSNPPRYLTDATVVVDDPATGRKKTIPNPLLQYRVRDPNLASITLSSTFRPPGYQQALQSIQGDLRQSVALIFNTPNICWNDFATYANNEHTQCGSEPLLNSLESVHNSVHNTICGTMCNLDLAAFDPVFWFHHANIDRLGALWQALNPNTFVDRTISFITTYVQRSGTVDANTPLYPFHRDQNSWWTSAACRNVRQLGYTYVELESVGTSASSVKNAVQQRVNALYGTGRTLQQFSVGRRVRRSAEPRRRAVEPAEPASSLGNVNLGSPPPTSSLEPHLSTLISPNGTFSDYSARVTLNKAALPSTFTVHLFFGPVPTETGMEILAAVNRIGGFSALTMSRMQDNVVTGVIVLTDALLNKLVTGEFKDMDPMTVKAYCHSKLTWTITGADGKDYTSYAKKAGLSIQVFRTLVDPDGGEDTAPSVSSPENIMKVNIAAS